MGQSTDGILIYGYDLGGGGGEWQIVEAAEHGYWKPQWLAEDDKDAADPDWDEIIPDRLLAAHGWTETDWRVDGYWDRKKSAEAAMGVDLTIYCSGECPMYALAAKVITVHRGCVTPVDVVASEAERAAQDWDARLTWATQTLGITPVQPAPGWLLLSYWG